MADKTLHPSENLGNLIEENLGSGEAQEYDYLKIRRRCEEKMRTMDDNPLLLDVARLLRIKLN